MTDLVGLFFWSGVLACSSLFITIIYRLWTIWKMHVWSRWCQQIDLKKYGQWAVITGATDGIGKAYAMELAERGMDIILISRNEKKLSDTASEIEKLYGVKTFLIQADFSSRDCYCNIENKLEDKDVGILVNNVGILQFAFMEYHMVDKNFLWNEIDINCGATAMMTRIVLPKMKQKRNGLIVNMSSLSSVSTLPCMSLYASTKSFINMFSLSIEIESEHNNIRIQNVMPYFIKTKLLEEGEEIISSLKSIASFMIPSPEIFAKEAVYTLNTNYLNTTGYWAHSLLELAASPIPLKIRGKILYFILKIMFLKKIEKS